MICDMRGNCGYKTIECLPLCDGLDCVWPEGCVEPFDFWFSFFGLWPFICIACALLVAARLWFLFRK